MNRRTFLASTVALGVVTASSQKTVRAKADKPNFLFIIADDLMYRTIGSLTNPEVHTPNMDRLAAAGCAFTRCFHQGGWSGAVCVPSRRMLNTGLSTFRAEKTDSPNQAASVPAWGQTLREAGYDTFITGKWHLDAVSLQRSFSEMGPVGPGFLPSTPDMYTRPALGNTWNPANKNLLGHWLTRDVWVNHRGDRTIQHSSELYADAAIDHLTHSVPKKQNPFFMYVGFNAPHDPRQAPQEYLDMYPPQNISIPPNFLPQHPFDQGDYMTRDELLAPFPRTKDDVRTHRREYYAIISHMDAQIGRIFAALKASGEADNTYVILTADHGLAVGEHGLMGKQNQYECSMRMPLMISGPGIKAGKRVEHMVYQHSMYATTCDLAGIEIPPHVDFPSLAPMLRKENTKPLHDAMYGRLSVIQRSLRTERHKLIFYPHINRYQLFDLDKDPWEMHDVVDVAEYESVKRDLIAALKQQQKQLGDPLDLDHPTSVPDRNDF